MVFFVCYNPIIMSHTVWLSSAFCMDEYPSNNGCEFTNELNQPLDLDNPNEQWCVTASEIIYEPDFWQNVRTSFNRIEIKISNFRANQFVVNARLRPKRAFVRPLKGQDFPKVNGVEFEVDVQFDLPPKREGEGFHLKKFRATITNSDENGNMIQWVKVGDWYWYEETYGPLTITEEMFRELEGQLYGAVEEHVILPYQGRISNNHRLNDFLWNTVIDLVLEKDPTPPPSPPPPTQQSWFERKTGKKHKHRKTEFETQTTGLLKIPVMYPSKEMGIHGPIADIAFMPTGYYEDPNEFLKDLNNKLNNKIYQMFKNARAEKERYLWNDPKDYRYVKFYREKGKVIFQIPGGGD